jgi:hypothetical protein
MTVDRKFTAVVRLINESRFGQAASWTARIWAAAWASSVVVVLGRQPWDAVLSWPVAHRVRLAALAVAWSAVCHVASRFVLPSYVTSGLPLWWPASILLAALVVAAMPEAFVRAWRGRFHVGQKSHP